MLKLNGNRIDPSEVEAALKKGLNINFAAVKQCFRGGISFLSAYIPKERMPVPEDIRESLKKYLPEFMLPACFIGIDKLPVNENGKTVRKALPDPSEEALFADYVAPHSDLEKILCAAFAEVLNIGPEKVGIDDNFFLLGGDSLSAMRLIIKADLKDLDFHLIYREKTVRNIAAVLTASVAVNTDTDSLPSEGLPLLDEQLWFLSRQLEFPNRPVCNQSVVINLSTCVDTEKLKKAILSVLDSHPALRCMIMNKNDGWRLFYDPNSLRDIEIESLPDEDLRDRIDHFPKVLGLDGDPLIDILILRGNKSLYLMIDISHILCDGLSLKIIAEDILRAYNGESIPKSDGFFSLMKKRLRFLGSPERESIQKYFNSTYGVLKNTLPSSDVMGHEPGLGEYVFLFPFSVGEVSAAAKKLHTAVSSFYLMATAITLMTVDKKEECFISWTWDGRSSNSVLRTVGLLTIDLPIKLHINKRESVSELVFEIMTQINAGIMNGSFSPFMKNDTPGSTNFIYNGDHLDIQETDLVLDADIIYSKDQAALEPLEISVWENPEGSHLELSYDRGVYSESFIKRFADVFSSACKELIIDDPGNTPVLSLIQRVMDTAG